MTPLEMTSGGNVDWNGNVVANVLDLDLDLDLSSAATFAASAADGKPQISTLKSQLCFYHKLLSSRLSHVHTPLSHIYYTYFSQMCYY